ncbi:efflux RND transporter periplasmic adaptor subunit [Sphingomonas prati]|uniref:HlyD family secretion protein n=1 Tax=Sphingomonas prati TaxID=1843237 RepID=A0A7W9F1L9_9SPHN|nr:efflux RND transporter periplasmic adaptor subunit [Sphingomonas prati]MBB5729617.1 HlyD family secretion protein [Sphingomonas prati]GGE76070.1 secretion protein HlyD [Sphingomonas prati]
MDQTQTPGDLDAFLGAKPPSRRSKILKWTAVAIGFVLLGLLAIRLFGGDGDVVRYATTPLERGNLTVTVSATGNLQPTNQVDVGSQTSGLVTRVNVDNNDRVTTGQVLATIDTATLQDTINRSAAAIAAAEANVGTAQATARQANANLKRLQEVYRLSNGKVPSATELDTGRAEAARGLAGVRSAQAAVAQARAQLSSDRTQFERASVKSPVNGVVLSRQIEPGQTVAASLNAPVLFVIAEDLSRMRLEVKVDEADVGQVLAGQRATFSVDAFPGRTFPARIERVDVGANSGTTTSSTTTTSTTGTVVAYTARLTVENPNLLLRPGMTATADIVTTERQNVLMVPNAALRFTPPSGAAAGGGGVASMLTPRGGRGGGATRQATIGRGSKQAIYVLGADGKPQRLQVTVGDTDGTMTMVSGEGVKPGLKVITGTLAGSDGSSAAAGAGAGGGGRRSGGQ